MAKCKACPYKKTCKNECYGDNPCDFAKAFDSMARKIDRMDTTIKNLRTQNEFDVGHRNKKIRSLLSEKIPVREFGEYMLTPVKSEANGKVSWWISKKGFTTARYCFTASDEKEVEYQIKNGLSGYMSLLDDTLQGADAVDRIDRLLKDLLWALPKEPRSDLVDNDPGFWTDGDEILCPSEAECEALANFLEDVLQGLSSITVQTGYYDPEEDARNGEVDEHTGFYYIKFE